ncbi:OmpP1/FadL family transporter [Brachymonas sp. M4Q-1]|uniref:OmpP1/FadL family transporter n=1 Tax=Brachymonas sp. M4Q-1 TaxID=3416906 RepID=UPI003CF09343
MRNKAFGFALKGSMLCVLAGWAGQAALASGYHFGTQSVSEQATANSSGAEAANPSTIFYNPAGLTYLPGVQFGGSLNLVAPSVKYSNAQAKYPGGTAVQGQTSGKITKDLVAVPHLYGSWQLNDRWTAGLGIYVPFASETEYDGNSVLRYNVNRTKLTSIDINPTIAYRLTDRQSVGFGLIAQYSDAELRQYANWGPLAATDPRVQAVMRARGRANPNGMLDGVANVSGNDWGFGFNAGWLWDVTDAVRIGASYRSKISHTLSGTTEWSVGSDALGIGSAVLPAIRAAGYAASEGTKVKIVTPESLSLHGMWKVNPVLNLFGDVTWTRHSRFNQLNIQYDNAKMVANAVSGGVTTASATTIAPLWRDTYKVAIGASYQYSDPLQLRFGIAYDQSPVRSADTRLSTMPDNDRIWLSTGFKYDLNKHASLNMAYSYIYIKPGSANVNGYCGSSVASGAGATSCVSSRTNGSADYNSHAHILGIAYTYRF